MSTRISEPNLDDDVEVSPGVSILLTHIFQHKDATVPKAKIGIDAPRGMQIVCSELLLNKQPQSEKKPTKP